MKKQSKRGIVFKKTLIAKIDSTKVYGGFKVPTEATEETVCGCGETVISDETGHPIFF